MSITLRFTALFLPAACFAAAFFAIDAPPRTCAIRMQRHGACSGFSMDIKEANPGGNVPTELPDGPLGDQGSEKTWKPPKGEQGISNQPDDESTDELADPSKD